MKKPFFLPGVLMPRVCRAAVNMTRIRDGWMLDPFSGTGGILVEAELISDEIHVVGCDVQCKMVLGTRTNLRFYGHNFDVVREDSLRMGIKDNSADAMITDFPYGQSTPIVGAPVGEFYIGALREMRRVLKKEKYAVIISMAPMEKLLREAEPPTATPTFGPFRSPRRSHPRSKRLATWPSPWSPSWAALRCCAGRAFMARSSLLA
jgi:tRNA (guanine10-N2)-dimethyltransferase